MKLPDALARVFSKERTQDPIAAARALYDLDGHLGETYVAADDLLSQLGAVLDKTQKQCLMANVIAVAMVDGALQGEEQECLQRFKQAMEISPEEYAALYDVLLLKNNLTVLAVPPNRKLYNAKEVES